MWSAAARKRNERHDDRPVRDWTAQIVGVETKLRDRFPRKNRQKDETAARDEKRNRDDSEQKQRQSTDHAGDNAPLYRGRTEVELCVLPR